MAPAKKNNRMARCRDKMKSDVEKWQQHLEKERARYRKRREALKKKLDENNILKEQRKRILSRVKKCREKKSLEMVKKRRLQGSPGPGPGSSKARFDGRSTSGGDDVTVARALLKEALHDIIHTDEDSSSSQDDTPTKTLPIKKEPKPPMVRRRKRKPAADVELAFHHHTFVMKLFDRSVDLAQFKEDTPLYPICRAWIANKPRVPMPYPPIESPEIKREEEFNNFEMDLEGLRDVSKLPQPSSPPWTHRIPVAETPPLQGVNIDYSSEDLPTAEELLKGHLSRWGNVRRNWIEAAQTNESRFAQSAKILSNMYKRSQNLL